jgi:hypothetical protein
VWAGRVFHPRQVDPIEGGVAAAHDALVGKSGRPQEKRAAFPVPRPIPRRGASGDVQGGGTGITLAAFPTPTSLHTALLRRRCSLARRGVLLSSVGSTLAAPPAAPSPQRPAASPAQRPPSAVIPVDVDDLTAHASCNLAQLALLVRGRLVLRADPKVDGGFAHVSTPIPDALL